MEEGTTISAPAFHQGAACSEWTISDFQDACFWSHWSNSYDEEGDEEEDDRPPLPEDIFHTLRSFMPVAEFHVHAGPGGLVLARSILDTMTTLPPYELAALRSQCVREAPDILRQLVRTRNFDIWAEIPQAWKTLPVVRRVVSICDDVHTTIAADILYPTYPSPPSSRVVVCSIPDAFFLCTP
jgi:hypothetical protein